MCLFLCLQERGCVHPWLCAASAEYRSPSSPVKAALSVAQMHEPRSFYNLTTHTRRHNICRLARERCGQTRECVLTSCVCICETLWLTSKIAVFWGGFFHISQDEFSCFILLVCSSWEIIRIWLLGSKLTPNSNHSPGWQQQFIS